MHGVHRRSKLSVFAEAAARLTPHAAPERLPCRERELEEVTSALRSAVLEGGLGASLYISGTPGTGKTATVHQALRELAADEKLPPFRQLELNGMKLSSPYDVYTLLWEQLTGQNAIPSKAAPLLDKHLSAAGGGGASKKSKTVPLILILDELDYLVTRKQSVIYNLFEWATRGTSALIVVGISNTMDLPERLLPRVHSRLGIRRVNFLPYDRIALASIIADRLGGLAAFEADGCELCSRKVASDSGYVRRSIEVCRLATTLAERDDLAAYNKLEAEKKSAGRGAPRSGAAAVHRIEHVEFRHIDEAAKQLRGSCLMAALQAAPFQQLLLLSAFVMEQAASGRAEIGEVRLLQRHNAVCAQLLAARADAPNETEQREMVARLCAARLLAPAGPAEYRLTVTPDDVKYVCQKTPESAALFPDAA